MRILSSTIARLVIAIFVLQLASSGGGLWLLHRQMVSITEAEQVRQIGDLRDVLLADYRNEGLPGVRELLAYRRKTGTEPQTFIILDGPDGREALHIHAMAGSPPTGRPGTISAVSGPDRKAVPGLAVSVPLDGGNRLIVGTYQNMQRGLDLAFAEALGLTLIVTTVLASASAVGLGIYISRRTHAIAETAEALATGDFSARVRLESSGDGFQHLRQQINSMAERIAGLVEQLGTVSASLAHDLRSPVARLRAAIDTALDQAVDQPTIDALLMARNDADVLQRMLSTALELSRLESGTVVDRRIAMDISPVPEDLVELYEPLAESQGISLTCTATPAFALADRELLSRAVANLIDNALKYGHAKIVVRCSAVNGWAVISVTDDGPGIPLEDRERALARFGRLDNARTQPGAGLGLAMAAAVAQLHHGALELVSAGESGDKPGLSAILRIPLATPGGH